MVSFVYWLRYEFSDAFRFLFSIVLKLVVIIMFVVSCLVSF